MLTLLTFPGSDHLPTHSPFGMKAMCLLQMSGVSWKPEYITDLTAMPLGRVPVLRADDRLIPDSHNIQAYLEDHGAKLNDGLSATERAISHALVRMIEDGMRLGLVHDRWLHPDVWPVMRDQFFAQVPEQARETVGEEVRGHVRAGLMSQGIAQFDEADRLRRMEKDVDALATLLDDKPFLFADHPTAVDAIAGPVLDMICDLPAPTGLRKLVQDREKLVAYVAAVRAAIYPPQPIAAVA